MAAADVVLIGAGPIGLEMAVALKEAGLSYVHLEAQQLGHTISWFPRQAQFFSSPERIAICGVPLHTIDQSKANREEYLAYLVGVVQQFGLKIQTYERVTRIVPPTHDAHPQSASDVFEVHTQRADGPKTYAARRVIVAVGGMHGPRRLEHPTLPEVPGADLPHVSHYFVEPHPYIGRKLLVIGGRNSAAEAALRCHRAGADVAISYRRGEIDKSVKYWLRPEVEWLIKHNDIAFYPHTLPMRITPTSVTLRDTRDRSERDVAADFVLALIGYVMNPSLLTEAGVDLAGESRHPVYRSTTMETNVPGLYVAGTAAGGTQLRFRLFIENGHCHVVRILRALAGQDPVHINPLAFRRLDASPQSTER